MKKEVLRNIVFSLVVIIIIVIIMVISFNYHKDSDNPKGAYYFDILEFKNVSPIGIPQFMAIVGSNEDSVTLFCNNEDINCYNELKSLDKIMGDNNKAIEYINVVELVDSEKETLSELSDIFNGSYYPNLVVIRDGKIVNNSNEFLEKDAIEKFLKDNEFIS